MPGVEAADFDCATCGAAWTAWANIQAGFTGQADVSCPECGGALGTVRCDSGEPMIHPRRPDQENLGFVRVYAGDTTIAMLTARR